MKHTKKVSKEIEHKCRSCGKTVDMFTYERSMIADGVCPYCLGVL